MTTKKISEAKTITLEKLQAAFKDLKIPEEDAAEYLASTEGKANKKAAKAKAKFDKVEFKWEKGALKDLDKDVKDGIKWARKTVGI